MADTFLCIHFIFLRDLWHHGCLKSGSDDSPSSGEFEEGKSRDLSVPYLHSPLHFTCPTRPHWPTSDPTVRAQPTVLWTNATTDLYLSSVRSEKAYQLSWRLPTCTIYGYETLLFLFPFYSIHDEHLLLLFCPKPRPLPSVPVCIWAQSASLTLTDHTLSILTQDEPKPGTTANNGKSKWSQRTAHGQWAPKNNQCHIWHHKTTRRPSSPIPCVAF